MRRPIYLDYNATTPHDPKVIDAIRPFLEGCFGNPSSSHAFGSEAKVAVNKAREQVASALGAVPEEIVFTSGGTESNNHAIKGAAWAGSGRGKHIITSSIEHPAVLDVCKWLTQHGFEITVLPVDQTGLVDPDDLRQAIRGDTILVTIMHANNEVGTIQPIRALSDIAHSRGALMHTDAAQSVGKIAVDVEELGVDLLSTAGHKLYAPKGVGALYIRRGVNIEKFMHGAGHEQDRRAGTENVLEIVGLGKAFEIARLDLEKNALHMHAMRERLYCGLIGKVSDLRMNGHIEKRLPNTLSVGFSGIDANALLLAIKDDVAASAGSACHSGGIQISPVLKAMNVPAERARGTVRFSTGRKTTADEIDFAVEVVARAVKGEVSGKKRW